jgi:xanthosine phosphorylase
MTESARLAAKIIQGRATRAPQFGIILGSGLSSVAQQITDAVTFSYQELPGFPEHLIEGQYPQLQVGVIQQTPVVCLQGRAHYYQGCDANQILTYVRTLKLLGCHTVIITGAVGSLRAEIKPGQLVLLKDHINLQGRNPLAGANDESFGLRFPDMTEAYDRQWLQQIEKIGHDISIPLMEGIYISVLGPSFETPTEIRLFREMGADVVGMSVVPEVIAARHCGLRVIGLTVVSNLAAGLTTAPQSHEETLVVAQQSTAQVNRLIRALMLNP